MAAQVTGAADWRSESEKRKSILRKACIALFKTWIPDHPEASMARGEVYPNFRDAMTDFSDSIVMVSLLSFGSEDMFVHDFLPMPLSMQELLVQREGTDAFLDPKNALRVVRRKFGMMTLISRMSSTFEQRNVIAVRLKEGISQEELVQFGRAFGTRVEGTAAEEEIELKKRLKATPCPHVNVLYHSDLVGRRAPVPWPVKEVYSLLGRRYRRKRNIQPEELTAFCHEHVKRLNAKALRQLSIYADELATDLDAGGLDPYAALVKAADERLMLTATRSIFDEFREMRGQRRLQRGLDAPDEDNALHDEESDQEDPGAVDAPVAIEVDADAEFVAEVETEDSAEGEDTDEFLRVAQALERIRNTLGKAFFHRISMVSGDVNFVDTALAGTSEVGGAIVTQDPVEALRLARDVTEPFYRARSLSETVLPLINAGKVELAGKAAQDALAAARSCQTEDQVSAYSVSLPALINAEEFKLAGQAVEEALSFAHKVRSDDDRAASIMRVVSTLMETNSLPANVRRSLSRSLLSDDVHFWGKSAVKSPLVEAVLALLSDAEDDTLIYLQKVVVHPDNDIRKSVLRTLPLGENEHIRNMLVSHLKDHEASVRVEVMERIGTSGDQGLGSYLVNLFRRNEATTSREKRFLALNLARLDHRRHLPLFNAMLGKLATKEPRYTSRYKPIADDRAYQIAGLEVLFHLKNRESRKLIYNAATKGRGSMVEMARRVWNALKSQPYGDVELPRSSHDPEYSDNDQRSFEDFLGDYEREFGGPDAALTNAPTGFLGRLKAKFLGESPPTSPPTAPPPSVAEQFGDVQAPSSEPIPDQGAPAVGDPSPIGAGDANPDITVPDPEPPAAEREVVSAPPLGPARAALRIEALLSQTGNKWSGSLPMCFRIYAAADAKKSLWSEEQEEVMVTAGRFEVTLGVETTRLPGLPRKIWLGIEVEGDELTPRMELSAYRSVVQG